jgi:hypothetical protein
MFFKNQPDILYPYQDGYKQSKNFFRRVRFRDNINTIYINSTKYTIIDGETPEIVSQKFYKSPQWYWSILLLNNIIDVNSQWPLPSAQLESYIENVYGTNADKPRHWETKQIKNSTGTVVLKSGFVIEMYQGTTAQQVPGYMPSYQFKYKNTNNQTITLTGSNVIQEVTNREYEYQKNEEKREIYVLKKPYLNKIQSEFKNLLKYDTDYKINERGIKLPEV